MLSRTSLLRHRSQKLLQPHQQRQHVRHLQNRTEQHTRFIPLPTRLPYSEKIHATIASKQRQHHQSRVATATAAATATKPFVIAPDQQRQQQMKDGDTLLQDYVRREVLSAQHQRQEERQEVLRCDRPGYKPLPTDHPAFGQRKVLVPLPRRRTPLSTSHPAFGDTPTDIATQQTLLNPGKVTIGGFFMSIDPNLCISTREQMNPHAFLTVHDAKGYCRRLRYKCHLRLHGGLKMEALLRFQLGWISPAYVHRNIPQVIRLGKGLDVSFPFLFHFTMVELLDENGYATGSNLYLSGTPLMGFSLGMLRVTGGKLTLSPESSDDMDPEASGHMFIHLGSAKHTVHLRQVGIVSVKLLAWLLCMVLCLPYVDAAGRSRRWLTYRWEQLPCAPHFANLVPHTLTTTTSSSSTK